MSLLMTANGSPLFTPSPSIPLPPAGEGSGFPSPTCGRGVRGEGKDEPFAVINSDIYCDYDFAQLPIHATALAECGDMAHLVLANNPSQHPNGDFYLHAGQILPTNDQRLTTNDCFKFTFSGIGVYQPALFAPIARGSSAPLAPLLRAQIAQGKVSGEHYTGRWVDVGTPQRLEELDKLLRATHNASHA